MKFIKIKPTNNYSNEKKIKLFIKDKYYLNKVTFTLILNYPLEIINGIPDELIIPVNNGIINQAYIKRLIYRESTNKEEIIKKYLDIPNIFLFKGVNYIKTNCKYLKIEMENKYE